MEHVTDNKQITYIHRLQYQIPARVMDHLHSGDNPWDIPVIIVLWTTHIVLQTQAYIHDIKSDEF